jgi:glycosyltransferase involved in cell wall biosynthesis
MRRTDDSDNSAPLDVLVFGSYDAARHPRVAVLRSGLARAGHRVRELNRPLGMSTADKVDAARSATGSIRFLRSVVRSWYRLVRDGRRSTAPDVVVVGYLGHLDVHLARLLWPRSTIVLDHMVGLAETVRDRAVGRGVVHRLLQAVDGAALRRADVVVVDTDEQRDQLPERLRSKAVVVPVGATDEWFDVRRPAERTLPLRVCFVGLYTPLQGATTIGATIRELADDARIEFTMIGDGQHLRATREAAAGGRAEWITWVPAAELPQVVAAHDVGLGIFGTTPKAFRVVPNKVYQSLAAGNVVVTSDTEPQRRLLGDRVRYVAAGDAPALAAELRAIADEMAGPAAGALFPEVAEVDAFRPVAVVRPLLERLGTTVIELPAPASSADPAGPPHHAEVLAAPALHE